ncbi:hypothetical protein LTR53_007573 [Teratosphaeriaceae sp. CCFEE 6253]|nr:hypothetical protein LTR53_007573 [Teratosphaeriaceae sp. CCFEE 6253]
MYPPDALPNRAVASSECCSRGRRDRAVRLSIARRCTAHKTYFQPPPQLPKPRRRILRAILYGAACIGVGVGLSNMVSIGVIVKLLGAHDHYRIAERASQDAVRIHFARTVGPLSLQQCQRALELGASLTLVPKAAAHMCQLPSNAICEDFFGSNNYNVSGEATTNWFTWSLFDGHAGPRTATLLASDLVQHVGHELLRTHCFGRPYRPSDPYIADVLKKAFLQFDEKIVNAGLEHVRSGEPSRAGVVAGAAAAFSGSCALVAFFDPVQNVLRVANTGDSRAVLGRWDEREARYVARPLSVDQTGFNEKEAARIAQEHPGEDVVDPKTGRVHGIAVSREFGDARWKWPQEATKRAHDLFWGPSPRPDSMVQTPPYLTAEPEVTETVLQLGEHPDFMIMASDGLWDNMSSENAVTCVQLWLDANHPVDPIKKASGRGRLSQLWSRSKAQALAERGNPFVAKDDDDDDVYFDESEQSLRWRVTPKHFVVEDDQCGVHLIKNALGGKRRDLFTGVMSVQPPLSRMVRDDITVQVVFFGEDMEKAMKR